MIRVCHVTSVHNYSDGRIFQKECKSLSKRYDVTLIAPNVQSHDEDGIHIVGVALPKSRLKRFFSLNRVYEAMVRVNADVYHFHDPELLSLGLKIKKRRKKIIFDCHEDVPNQILGKEWIPAPFRLFASYIYALVEKRQIKCYDAIISVTPSIVDRLKKQNDNTWQITNYPLYQELPDERKWTKSICFAGGIGTQWMHDSILQAVDKTKIKYVLAGKFETGYEDSLRQLEGWKYVDYKGVLKFDEVNGMLQNCSAGMALNDYVANVGYKQGSLGNTKLFEYMMAGIPVIATDFVLWKEIIEKYDCGICVDPHDVDAIADAITFFVNDPDEAKRRGDNGRRTVKSFYNWNSQETILFELYDVVSNNN